MKILTGSCAFLLLVASVQAVEVSTNKVTELISQLGDENFKQREAASTELKAIGKSVLPQLKASENHPDPEVRTRIAQLLQELDPPPANTGVSSPPMGQGVIQIGNGVIFQMNAVAVNAGGADVHASEETSFTKDNKDYKVARTTRNNVTKIKVEVTETKAGKEVTRVVEATSDEDLAKQDPELAKLVKREARQGAQIQKVVQLQMGGNVMVGGGAQVIFGNVEAKAGGPLNNLGFLPSDAADGLHVESVEDGSAAAKLGLKPGDVLTKANAKELKTSGDLNTVLDGLKPEDPLTLTVLRDGKPVVLKRQPPVH